MAGPDKTHCQNQRSKIYIALEDLDFVWDEKDVKEVDEMWESGIPLNIIAQNFGRDINEVAILIIDRRRNGFIELRDTGIFGRG